MSLEYLPIIFFLIALFYSSVGFGGGSSYLAILSLVLTDFYEIRSLALTLNVCVVAIGTIMYFRNNVLDFKAIWPFFILSIPMAFVGGQIKLSQSTFFLILGISLILAGLFMILKYVKSNISSKDFSNSKKSLMGGFIGLLSGISGIGGGIFLSPTLNLMHWKNPRVIASLASVFILVNSLAGIISLNIAGSYILDIKMALSLVIAVVIGGLIGSYLSSKRFNLKILGILTSILILYVGLRLVLFYGIGIQI
ncbi:sulfite exporter TauE/SafE family protein [Marinigracilibium pacificum]|uniref:Probable membrane transporter protein n=1 Tax=Marinigracilibium pacificum TaxID=2729599 RepID=A0A848IYD6_9BACT|nr:sulfite exporter TauE/SafE family protein [Marinigracilibium pacificum]NMM48295.1 sulfite exporter TauE/SafE family protein [Marinigracilibium pacificum]